jgi:hypothetical protein
VNITICGHLADIDAIIGIVTVVSAVINIRAIVMVIFVGLVILSSS